MDDGSNEKSSSTSINIPSSHKSLKSISLNILSSNSYNLNEGRILENNNENSYCDKDLNEKIIKLLIGDHTLLPMKTIEKIAYCNFMNQNYKNKDFYNIKVIDEIIHNESSHIVAEFKDYLIKGDISEFLQQYYKKDESLDLLPKIYEYYISCSVIFPNYVVLPESQYIYKNIQRKQRVIDIQQEQEDKEENIKNGLIDQEKEPTIFNTQAFDSILNQTDTSGVKQYFGISPDVSKGGGDIEMMKLVNNIEKAEKKIHINKKNKKNKINVCKLKKGNNNGIIQYENTMLLNEAGYSKKIQKAFHNKKNSPSFFERKKSGNNKNNNNEHNKIVNKNYIKHILRQSTENNNNCFNKKINHFSTQITYIDSCNNPMKNVFDLKGIESIKKIQNNSKENEEKGKQLYKNNSQNFTSVKNINSKERNSENFHIKDKEKEKENNKNQNNVNRDLSENYSINQSGNKNIKNEKNQFNANDHHKETISRNNEILNIENNIKTYFQEPLKNFAQSKNTITSYKTKSQTKHKIKGYQTSRNKYDNKNMYINVSKSNLSKNHQSIDSEIANCTKKKAINQIQSKHNNLKNNLINALLGSKNNNQKKKIIKYKDILIQKENNDSIANSIYLKNININENNIICDINIDSNEKNNLGDNDKENDINNNENQHEEHDKINNIFLYNNNEKTNSQSKRLISGSNLDSNNNKFSSSSCTKTMSINSYGTQPKYSSSSINTLNHKKQISMSKIPTSFPENKILHNKNKKSSNKNIVDDIDNKNKIKELIDNYLEDYFSSNAINNFSNTQAKNFIQEEYNNILGNNNNYKINNFFNENKSKSKNKRKNEVLSIKNLSDKKKEKDENNKIRNSIFNFEKSISKKLSEKNINIFDKFKTKISPKIGSTKRTSVRINKSGNIQNNDGGPLSARESNSKYQLNAEMIELLSNKIQKIKQSIKETSDKGSNSISSIFKKKKIPSAGRKPSFQGSKKNEENIEKKTQTASSKTRNKKNSCNLIGATPSISNIGLSGNLVNTIINSIYQTHLLSPNKKNIEYDKLMKTFQKFKRLTNSFNGNNNSNNSKSNYNNNNNVGNKKDSQKKKKHGRSNSIYSNNLDNHFNIEVNIKNNMRAQSKKSINNKNTNDNHNSLNINFNNYTNNYNYNYNINNNTNNVNYGNINNNYNNCMINKGKSNSQKIIMGKVLNKNEINFKGIPINGFEKLITKKYNTRNYNIPMSVTDRIKQNNIYSTSIASNNTNSNRYSNSNNRHINSNNKISYKKK